MAVTRRNKHRLYGLGASKRGEYLEDHPSGCKCLGSPAFISHLGHLDMEEAYLGDLGILVLGG